MVNRPFLSGLTPISDGLSPVKSLIKPRGVERSHCYGHTTINTPSVIKLCPHCDFWHPFRSCFNHIKVHEIIWNLVTSRASPLFWSWCFTWWDSSLDKSSNSPITRSPGAPFFPATCFVLIISCPNFHEAAPQTVMATWETWEPRSHMACSSPGVNEMAINFGHEMVMKCGDFSQKQLEIHRKCHQIDHDIMAHVNLTRLM